VFGERLDGSAVAGGAADTGAPSRESTTQPLSVEARERVSRHLSAVRAMRRAEWPTLLDMSRQP